jgi:hypothetical protein
MEKNSEMYQVISSVEELEWFFNHALFKPLPYESYSMVMVSKHKKLTKEEQETIGLTRKESEFLAVQCVRAPKIDHIQDGEEAPFEFEKFLRHVRRFNVDKYAYTTALGQPLPEKTLAVLIYVNPADDIKVADKVVETINNNKSAIVKAALADKKYWSDVLPIYQNFSNLESNIKHYKAQCKGSVYWMDYDIDVPAWFKNSSYYLLMKKIFDEKFGKGNYIVVDTGGGYHVLVRTCKIKFNPHIICEEVEKIYKQGIADGNPEHLDENGKTKFEAMVNDSQIPGLPLPGTYQYGRPVTVLNKEDFE